ncbi:Asp/Glu/Hydantoin racemase [Caulifigura coniformis]|uniref:Asp/Glu/Hydantoin racemase n=1 Tax=Caulifigura coniformis TaxID=2527983 RepID=A0A517SIE0_9PLAN|nr:aspartate/glutamate racemase family protein [Caulifigura coniformis]QDT55885.1 Asp/Glu/Hydantoin racemase [Caulifigura coniformis]
MTAGRNSEAPLVACVHATPRAIDPTEMLLKTVGPVAVHHLIDEQLLAAGDDAAGPSIFRRALQEATSLRPAVVLTTCSMYTRFLDALRQHTKPPLLGIDEPMIDHAARTGGRLGFVGSIETAVQLTAEEVLRRARAINVDADVAETLLVPRDSCDTDAGRRTLAAQIQELRSRVDHVVVVQLSLSPAVDLLTNEECRSVFTAVPFAATRIRSILGAAAT